MHALSTTPVTYRNLITHRQLQPGPFFSGSFMPLPLHTVACLPCSPCPLCGKLLLAVTAACPNLSLLYNSTVWLTHGTPAGLESFFVQMANRVALNDPVGLTMLRGLPGPREERVVRGVGGAQGQQRTAAGGRGISARGKRG